MGGGRMVERRRADGVALSNHHRARRARDGLATVGGRVRGPRCNRVARRCAPVHRARARAPSRPRDALRFASAQGKSRAFSPTNADAHPGAPTLCARVAPRQAASRTHRSPGNTSSSCRSQRALPTCAAPRAARARCCSTAVRGFRRCSAYVRPSGCRPRQRWGAAHSSPRCRARRRTHTRVRYAQCAEQSRVTACPRCYRARPRGAQGRTTRRVARTPTSACNINHTQSHTHALSLGGPTGGLACRAHLMAYERASDRAALA